MVWTWLGFRGMPQESGWKGQTEGKGGGEAAWCANFDCEAHI